MRRLPQLTKLVLASLILVPTLQLLVAPASHAAIVSRGLIARWDAKNPASYPGSGTIWKDISGKSGQDATLVNGATTKVETFTGVVHAPAMQFYNTSNNVASNKYATVPSGFMFNVTSGFSISFYANFGPGGSWDHLIDFGNGAENYALLISRNGTGTDMSYQVFTGPSLSYNQGYCTYSGGITNSAWNHYVYTFDGSKCRVYKNGTKVVDTAYTGLPNDPSGGRTNNYIGRSNWSGDYQFEGGIADLALYNVTLTDAEVLQNYNEQTAAQVDSITSLAPASAIVGVGSYSLVDTSTSQIAPTHTVDPASTSVCSISGNTVSFIGPGTCTINSSVPASTNYSASASVSQSFSVSANTSLSFTFSGNATYRQITSLSATVAPVTGRITFYAQGKAIPGCKNVLVSSSPYACSWKPSQHSSVTITATYDPTASGYSTVNSNPTAIRVVPRSGTR